MLSLSRIPCLILGTFRDIRGNARAMIAFEPMWAIPFVMCNVYATLYMRALGLSPERIGLLASVGFASYVCCSAFAGHLTDRLGRRRATLVFDLLGWSVPVLIWAFARDFRYFLAATLINGLQAIPATSWSCLLVEDTQPEERLSIFTVLQMVAPLAGLVTPLAGLVVRRFGVVRGARSFYLFAFFSMTAMFIGRNHFTRESVVGQARQAATDGHTLRDSLRDYLRSLSLLAANRAAVSFFLLAALLAFRDSLTAPFYQLLQVDRIRLSKDMLAVFPAVGGVATLATLFLVLPWLRGTGERKGMYAGLVLSAAALITLVWAPPGSVFMVSLSTLAGATGGAILMPALNTGWYNSLGDAERAKIVAVAMLIWSLVRLPAGYLGGVLYARESAWPFLAGLGLLLCGMALLVLVPASQRVHAGGPPDDAVDARVNHLAGGA